MLRQIVYARAVTPARQATPVLLGTRAPLVARNS